MISSELSASHGSPSKNTQLIFSCLAMLSTENYKRRPIKRHALAQLYYPVRITYRQIFFQTETARRSFNQREYVFGVVDRFDLLPLGQAILEFPIGRFASVRGRLNCFAWKMVEEPFYPILLVLPAAHLHWNDRFPA